ncbi:hypothetical protein C3L33_08301, partial [Rhododendron williamsianum]
MNPQLLNSPILLRPSSSLPPTTRSTKFLNDPTKPSTPPLFLIRAAKRQNPSRGLQKQPNKDLSRILRTEAAINAIERKANSNKYNQLWPKAVLDSLDEAIRENRWESALKVCGQPKQAGFLFELIQSDGLEPTVDVYTALVSAYGLSGLLDEAFHTLDLMKSVSDCRPDVYTYSILINCCMKLHRFHFVKGILAEMSYLGVECSAVTYNTIIDGYGKAKLFEPMENSLTDMIESDACNPDVFTLNSFIGAYGNCGKIVEMEKWFEEFQLMGIGPDIKTFNILIKSYGKAGMYEKMGSVLEFMKKRFFSPTVVTFNTIIEAFGRSGNIEKMEEFFLKMKHQGMKPTSVTYCTLVSAYSKSGLLHRIDSIMRQVENSDVVLDTAFFNCVISAYGRAGNIKRMGELLLAMKERNCKLDNITLATLIQAYKKQGMIEAVKELEDKMISDEENSGMLPNFST